MGKVSTGIWRVFDLVNNRHLGVFKQLGKRSVGRCMGRKGVRWKLPRWRPNEKVCQSVESRWRRWFIVDSRKTQHQNTPSLVVRSKIKTLEKQSGKLSFIPSFIPFPERHIFSLQCTTFCIKPCTQYFENLTCIKSYFNLTRRVSILN